jgi:hypothetical protein
MDYVLVITVDTIIFLIITPLPCYIVTFFCEHECIFAMHVYTDACVSSSAVCAIICGENVMAPA